MSVSNEFAQAVQDRNLLRVRIMLKDSLLLDKSFRSFDEMQKYSSAHGLNPWADEDIKLERADKPWTEDTMDYELTALVNDFTEEHVKYVKDIVTSIYGEKNSISHGQSEDKVKQQLPTQQSGNKDNSAPKRKNISDPYQTLLEDFEVIERILNRNKPTGTRKRIWPDEDIEKIKRRAYRMVLMCKEIQKGGDNGGDF